MTVSTRRPPRVPRLCKVLCLVNDKLINIAQSLYLYSLFCFVLFVAESSITSLESSPVLLSDLNFGSTPNFDARKSPANQAPREILFSSPRIRHKLRVCRAQIVSYSFTLHYHVSRSCCPGGYPCRLWSDISSGRELEWLKFPVSCYRPFSTITLADFVEMGGMEIPQCTIIPPSELFCFIIME